MNGASFGARGEMSESGWSNGDLLKMYLQEHFLPYARTGADEKQIILLVYDGHSSHVSPSLIKFNKWARSQNLILFVLPTHSTHFLYPLDVSLLGPFKTFYYSECSAFQPQGVICSRCVRSHVYRLQAYHTFICNIVILNINVY